MTAISGISKVWAETRSGFAIWSGAREQLLRIPEQTKARKRESALKFMKSLEVGRQLAAADEEIDQAVCCWGCPPAAANRCR